MRSCGIGTMAIRSGSGASSQAMVPEYSRPSVRRFNAPAGVDAPTLYPHACGGYYLLQYHPTHLRITRFQAIVFADTEFDKGGFAKRCRSPIQATGLLARAFQPTKL